MNKKVCVKIKGLHDTNSPEEDEIEVIYIGSYYKRNGKHYVRYEEPVEGSSEVNQNTLKISPNEVELMSKGSTGHHMLFSLGKKSTTYYETPYGGLNMGVDTYDLEVVEEDDSISIDIKYGLEINLDFMTQCRVCIKIESIGDN